MMLKFKKGVNKIDAIHGMFEHLIQHLQDAVDTCRSQIENNNFQIARKEEEFMTFCKTKLGENGSLHQSIQRAESLKNGLNRLVTRVIE